MEKEKKPFYKKWWVLGVLILYSFIMFAILGSKSNQPTTQMPAQAKQAISQSVSVGEEGYINTPSPQAILAFSKDGYDELTKIYIAKDTMGISEFLLSGKGFVAPTGTKVLVLDITLGARRVRVLEGDSIGKAGWIAAEWVSKSK